MSESTQIIPWSGEVLDLEKPQDALRGYQAATEFRGQLNLFQAACKETLIEEAGRQGKLTFQVGGQKVRVDGEGVEATYDVGKLAELKQAGLPDFRWNDLVEWVPKVNQRVANELSRSNPEYARIITEATTATAPKRRSVRIGG